MSYPAAIKTSLSLLEATGIARFNYAPPPHRLLWCVGIPVPPPHLASARFNFLFFAIWFGAAWGTFTWYSLLSPVGAPIMFAVTMAFLIGGAFGYGLALYYRHAASKYNLIAP
ncbi:DUF6404 family protein [Collimonas humicola]|uniref:DUF6404 family protein n=1 Tax=Collimonas humicola TaxID=2825886 RepID=UPI001B8C5494|nr:DUF6404 family protein [Collimonas humicola]